MKKTYISPAIDVTIADAEQMLAASITQVNGPIGLGEGDAPDEADVKGNFYGESIFED